MAFIRKILMPQKTNSFEKGIISVLKEERKRRIESVKIEGEKFLFVFSNEKTFGLKTIVKQFPKTKYETQEMAIKSFIGEKRKFKKKPMWKPIQVLEVPNYWIAFFEKII